MRRGMVAALGGVLMAMGSRSLVAQDSQFGIRGLGAPGTFASVRAWSTGGAFAAFDGMSSLTDAALSDVTRLTASATSIDDYRRVNDGTNQSSLRSSRFPMLQVAGPVFGKLVVGGGFSTYLYRSYTIQVPGTVMIRGLPETYVDKFGSDGAVTDLRLAAAWSFSPRLVVGGGFHILTGSSKLTATRVFSDSSAYLNSGQTEEESYDGIGVSLSVLATPLPGLRVSGFMRSDNHLRAEVSGFQNAQSDLPTSIGGAIQWTVTPEVKVAGAVTHANWSVSSTSGTAFNTTNWSIGGEFGRASLPIRLGVRGGQMPFGPGPTPPTQLGISAGTGFIFSQGRGILDFGLEHLRRSGGGLTENGWVLMAGLTVRP
ncbi:MAG TPA: hypothetical protein VH163_01370 [Gemmatimonadales bacterium]|nr:hypothetical protein [Gemmatimonadales bacterium]